MPFEKERPWVSGDATVARSVSAAQKKVGGSPDGKLRKLIDRFEGNEQERPNESKICTFCGATRAMRVVTAARLRDDEPRLWHLPP
jgi:hypothetical protein